MKFFYFTLSGAIKKLAGVAFMLVLAVSEAPALPAGTSAYSSSWADDQAHPALKAFSSWTTRFSAAPTPTAKAQLISEGVSLAQARRATLAKLIQVDPQKALGFAVPASLRDQRNHGGTNSLRNTSIKATHEISTDGDVRGQTTYSVVVTARPSAIIIRWI